MKRIIQIQVVLSTESEKGGYYGLDEYGTLYEFNWGTKGWDKLAESPE